MSGSNIRSSNPYNVVPGDSEGSSEPSAPGLPHFVTWALERAYKPFHEMRLVPFAKYSSSFPHGISRRLDMPIMDEVREGWE